MSILSDTTLQRRIKAGELVLGGDPKYAKHCSYEFRPGRIVFGGTSPDNRPIAVDFLAPGATTASVLPTAVVWVRTLERVKIPPNMVGLWVQTNSLSRQGLLLLNTTLVEPGYEGFLTAHLVNLGTQPAILGSETIISKVLFFQLDADASSLVDGGAFGNYDAFVDGLALRSSASFLRIAELVPELRVKIDDFHHQAQKKAEADFKTVTDAATETAKQAFLTMEKKSFTRIGSGFALGLLLAVTFFLWVFPRVRNMDVESRTRIQGIVTTELSKQLDTIRDDLRKLTLAPAIPKPAAPDPQKVP
jgi:deoxycytidine triphosphate deaminase